MKRHYKLHKWKPLLGSLAVVLLAVFLFVGTDLRFFLGRKQDAFLHLLKAGNPTATVREDLGFTVSLDPERGLSKGAVLGEDGEGMAVRVVSTRVDQFDLSMLDTKTGNEHLQFVCVLDFVGKMQDGRAEVLAPFAFPQKGSPFYENTQVKMGEGSLYLPQKFRYRTPDDPDFPWELNSDNIELVVGEEVFHPRYRLIEVQAAGGELQVRVYYSFFKTEDDFSRLIARSRTREIELRCDYLYVSEYRTNPVIRGILQ